jgi:putative hydrolase of the HAD superfamily
MISAVFFDAVGTLIHPEPPAAVVYSEIGARFGTSYSVEEIARRFVAAFKREEDLDRRHGWRTSEDRERQRWRTIVATVLDDVSDHQACFDKLYEHFAQPDAWRLEAATTLLLRDLKQRGLVIGLASNYDHRLLGVVRGLPELHCIDHIIVSAAVGWRKPAPDFFAAVCEVVAQPPERIVFVGDDVVNDYEGARAAGLRAFLLENAGQLQALRGMLHCP